MRILFIHEVNYSNKFIFEMHEFPELLALRGHKVSFFHYPEAPDHPRLSWRTKRETIAGRAYPESSIELVTPPTFGGAPLERYLAPLLNLPALRREIASGRYDLIVLYAVPTTGWQAVAIAKHYGLPIVFRALDVSHKIRKSPLSPLIRRAEKYIYRNVTLLSANNPAMAEYCIRASNRSGLTAVNLPPVDLTHFQRPTDDRLRAELGFSSDSRVILYMGSFFGFSGLDIFLTSIAPMLEAHPELVVLFVGRGELEPRLREIASELNVKDRVIFTGVVPYAELPGYLRAADVAINPFVPQLLTDVAFPHKVLQYMAAGVSAVSTSLRGLRGVLGDTSGVTWVQEPGDIAGVAVSLALGNPEKRREIVEAQREFVSRVFTKDLAVSSFEDALKSVG